jgi:SNF2 family DNA or RNA helicase
MGLQGLGKTLTTLALIRADLTGAGIIDTPEAEVDSEFSKATLISAYFESARWRRADGMLVCPLSVIGNWREQIRTHMYAAILSSCY